MRLVLSRARFPVLNQTLARFFYFFLAPLVFIARAGNSILGKAARLVKTGIPVDHDVHVQDPLSMEALFPGYKIVNAEVPEGGVRQPASEQSNAGLIIGNGAESRKTFHYFAEGYGAQVQSPAFAGIHPMVIDTRNREANPIDPAHPTRHGIVPRESNVPASAMYR